MKKTRLDDRGLTLLELIIGVVILAIIVTPLLHAFVTGANTAKRNKQYNDATVAAQNIVEDAEGSDLADFLAGSVQLSVPYTNADGSYVYTGKNKLSTYPKYVKSVSDAESGGSSFDAVVTVDGESSLNSSTVPFSNSMDAQIFMQSYDTTVYEQYVADGGKGNLQRTMEIDVDPITGNTELSKITVHFAYTGTFTDSDGKSQTFSRSVAISRNAALRTDGSSTDGTKKFAAYIFFSYYPTYNGSTASFLTNGSQTSYIVVNNNTASNICLYLVNTATDSSGSSQQVDPRPEIYYYTKNGKSLSFMSNLNNATCKVFTSGSSTWMNSASVPVNLVETRKIDRLYNITVDIYKDGVVSIDSKTGSVDSGGYDPIVTLTTSKLDYSIQ